MRVEMANPIRQSNILRFLSSNRTTIEQFAMGILGAVALSVFFYYGSRLVDPYLSALLQRLNFAPLNLNLNLKSADHFFGVKGTFTLIVAAAAVVRVVQKFIEQIQATWVNKRVADAISHLKDETPGANISDITADQVAASPALKGAKVDKKALDQLVEQHKQQMLIDDSYFREELGHLIVDYLQPLPRNAKRLLNRFRVNLLIAHGRGLFTTQPRVTTQQLGKWLVLMERWPQLGRALSAAPDRLKSLEETAAATIAAQSAIMSASPPKGIAVPSVQPEAAAAPAPPDPAARRSPNGAGSPQSVQSGPAPQSTAASDPFMDLIGILTPFYLGDEDLRKFIHSDPSIANVVARLAHFETGEPQPAEMASAG
jgi:hypothetical protein